MTSKVIAIDGPSGSGKSTVTKTLATRLGVLYIDTGAMFRALALHAYENKISLDDQTFSESLKNVRMEYFGNGDKLIAINGTDYTTKIREHFVSELASKISSLPSVRTYLLNFQRSLVKEKMAILEGRDIGTVVFPDAFCKIYLSASNEVRAKRRMEELTNKGQTGFTFDSILKDIIERDERDKNRAIAPLRMADDAILVDSSSLTSEQVIAKMTEIAKKCAAQHGLKL